MNQTDKVAYLMQEYGIDWEYHIDDIPDDWGKMKPFYIFLLGIISNYPPYNEMNPEEIYTHLADMFINKELKGNRK